MAVKVSLNVHHEAFTNYNNKTNDIGRPRPEWDKFHRYLGMTKQQSNRLWRKGLLKVSKTTARKIELLAMPNGRTLLKIWEAQNGKT